MNNHRWLTKFDQKLTKKLNLTKETKRSIDEFTVHTGFLVTADLIRY